jgi:hypothetical protein
MLELCDRKLVSSRDLFGAIIHARGLTNILAEHYCDPEVRSLLTEIVAKPGIDGILKQTVARVLDGDDWSDELAKRVHRLMNFSRLGLW